MNTESPLPADQSLPPVEPPSPGFLVQLFLIPMLIVSIIVGVWLLFSWAVSSGNNPEDLIADVERLNHASWQKALTLANQLRDPRNHELRRDQPLAKRMSKLLDEQIELGLADRDHVWLRMYLCRALGELEIDAGLDSLAIAVATEKDKSDLQVRRAALQALALLSGRLGGATVANNAAAVNSVTAAATSSDSSSDETDEEAAAAESTAAERALVRSTATYVLGLLPAETSGETLTQLLNDADPIVKYNAAAGLGRQGNAVAVDYLREMLQPDLEFVSAAAGQNVNDVKTWQRNNIVVTALRSIGRLRNNFPQVPLGNLPEVLQTVADDDSLAADTRKEAREVMRLFQ